MKVVCDGLDLSIATAQVIKAISNKTTNPVLEGIKLNAENDTLKLSATDLELAIEKTIKADVKSEGEPVIPGKFFSEFIKKLTDEKIELELNDKNRLKINYTDSESYIQCYNALEFPNLNTVDDGEYFTIKQKDFKTLIKDFCTKDDSEIRKNILDIYDKFINLIHKDSFYNIDY